MIEQDEKDLFLIRVERLGVKAPPPFIRATGSLVVLTVCKGQEDASRYISEERAAGPCRVWIAYIGDIRAERFVEQTL